MHNDGVSWGTGHRLQSDGGVDTSGQCQGLHPPPGQVRGGEGGGERVDKLVCNYRVSVVSSHGLPLTEAAHLQNTSSTSPLHQKASLTSLSKLY